MVLATNIMFSSAKEKLTLLAVIVASSVLLSLTMFRSGLNYDFGIGFWGPNGHDAVWHLSLINQLKINVPPANPIFSGYTLSNYHWGYDLVVALISKLIKIYPSILYFQILPIVFAIAIGLLSYKLSRLLTNNHLTSLLFVLFNYFSSSFGWIVTLIKSGQIGGESMFWSMQSASTLLNPPYALSLIILLWGLILWFRHKDSNSIVWGFVIGFILSLLCYVKVYSAILIGLSLSIYFIISFFKSKNISRFNLFVCLSMAVISIIILKSLGVLGSETLIEFKPFWFTRSMIESIDKFYWPKLASFRYNQTNFLITIILELFLVFIFLVGNLGVRIFGIYKIISKFIKKQIKTEDWLFFPILIISFSLPLFFVQKGTAWNTIQFFYYFLFIFNFYLAQYISSIYSNNKIIAILLVILASLGSFGTLKDYFGNPPPSALPTSEVLALNYLKNQPNGNVLTYPYDKYLKNSFPTPIPLYAYETTAYVSAFSEKPVFLEDEMNLDITGFDWKKRREKSLTFYDTDDKFLARGFLVNNNISYIYLVKDQGFKISEADLQVDQIYSQDDIKIFKVRR